MSFLRSEKTNLAVALDVESRTIKGLVYEISDKGSIVKAHKRIAVQMPWVSPVWRSVREIHDLLGGVIKEFGCVPAKTIIGFGASLAEYHVEQWDWDIEPGAKARLSRKDMIGYFSSLFARREKEDCAMIATPVCIEINGYGIKPGILRDDARRLLVAPGGTVRDIRFRTLISFFSSEIGTQLAEMKRMLGGVPIEFVPLASAYQEVLVNRLKVRDALLIDIGDISTMVAMLKDGTLVQTAAFPLGVFQIDGKNEKSVAVWSRSLEAALGFLYPFGPLTGETYLCGGGAYIPELRSFIEQGEWLKTLSYAASPVMTVLEGKSLLTEKTLKGFLRGSEDAGLAAVICYGTHHELIV